MVIISYIKDGRLLDLEMMGRMKKKRKKRKKKSIAFSWIGFGHNNI
jgi:hypothetical protein